MSIVRESGMYLIKKKIHLVLYNMTRINSLLSHCPLVIVFLLASPLHAYNHNLNKVDARDHF